MGNINYWKSLKAAIEQSIAARGLLKWKAAELMGFKSTPHLYRYLYNGTLVPSFNLGMQFMATFLDQSTAIELIENQIKPNGDKTNDRNR